MRDEPTLVLDVVAKSRISSASPGDQASLLNSAISSRGDFVRANASGVFTRSRLQTHSQPDRSLGRHASVPNDRVDSVKFGPPLQPQPTLPLPTDLASELAQYDVTESTSTPSTATANPFPSFPRPIFIIKPCEGRPRRTKNRNHHPSSLYSASFTRGPRWIRTFRNVQGGRPRVPKTLHVLDGRKP